MITFSPQKLSLMVAMSRKSYRFAGADDPATADDYPHFDVLPEVARQFLADGYPELSRDLSRPLE